MVLEPPWKSSFTRGGQQGIETKLRGVCSLESYSCINVLLTTLGYISGIIHAVWVIAKYSAHATPELRLRVLLPNTRERCNSSGLR